MLVIRSPALPAVVLVKGPGVCAVAIPDGLPSDEVLELASLVLSTREYEEVQDAVRSGGERSGADRASAVGTEPRTASELDEASPNCDLAPSSD